MFGFDVSTYEHITNIIYNGSLEDFNDILLNDKVYFGSYEHTVHQSRLDYLIINNQFFKYPNYLFGKTIDLEKAEKFKKTALVDRVYDNKDIIIYKNKPQNKR